MPRKFDFVLQPVRTQAFSSRVNGVNSVILLQARTSSSRLPAKVLLPINDVPVVVVAARRAANTGRQVIVATSVETSDDGLATLIQTHGLNCFRGDLNNVLSRFVCALSSYDDRTIVFRLTADNVFPDGSLLDEMEEEFLLKRLDYLCCNGEPSGLPYGMSVEVTRLGHLREAERESVDVHDQEHVTPYVIRKFGLQFFRRYENIKKGLYRCTIDCLDDYLDIQNVFSDVVDPIREPALELVRRLERVSLRPIAVAPVPRLVFGAAQLGGHYGVANTTGQPDKKMCKALIKTAITNGIVYIDTAHAYGNSESMIGAALEHGWKGRVKVVTKLSPLQECPPDASPSTVRAFIDASVYRSCVALGSKTIDVLLLHRATHLEDWSGHAWRRLLELQSSAVIGELGVSVQSPDELLAVLDSPHVQHIQLPLNLLDWRWEPLVVKILAVKADRKLTVHIRSALLQGLLPSSEAAHWRRAHVERAELIKDWLQSQVIFCNRTSITDLCLNYVNSLEWVDGVAIGMENERQLAENIACFNAPPLTADQIKTIQSTRPRLNEDTLNPALWKKAES